jgi:hypothetical protein
MIPPSPLLSAAQDQQHVLEGDHEHQAPEDRRHRADDVRRVERHADARAEDRLHRVERAGADVAVDDADRTEREGRQALAAGRFVHGGLQGEADAIEQAMTSGTHKRLLASAQSIAKR